MKKSSLPIAFLLGSMVWMTACSGTAKPDVRIVDLKGLGAALDGYRGDGLLVNFWAIWCEPCVAELPGLLETARNFGPRGGKVVSVSYDLMVPDATPKDVMQRMQAFVNERRIDIPVLIYEADDYDAINERFGLPGPIPATIAIDRQGKIVDRQEGESGKTRFAEMMEKALQK